jgi:hypothetical protein
MSGWYFQNLLAIAIVAVALFAWFKGRWPERLGAGANLAAAVAVLVGQQMMGLSSFAPELLVIDGLLGLSFMVLAVRFASLWLGAAMLLQAVQFTLHAFYYVTNKPFDRLFVIVNNCVSWGVLLSIVAGTLATWIRATRARAA